MLEVTSFGDLNIDMVTCCVVWTRLSLRLRLALNGHLLNLDESMGRVSEIRQDELPQGTSYEAQSVDFGPRIKI